ncbi:MAG: peptidyl-prolyl cis-trans isomerase [Candidatus Omnitrophica bacterium]|nr:peptidyl-prolyl cis-trans isomerase [Candidatus Omnitrophota bacterium]
MKIKIIKLKYFFKKWKGIIALTTLIIVILIGVIIGIIKERKKTIAIVNGYRIKIEELLEKISSSPEFYKEYASLNPQSVIDDYINQILLYQYAKKYERKLRRKIEPKLRNYYMELLTYEFVENILVNEIKISDEEISNYYNTHLQEFVLPERVQLFEIVVNSKEKADEILNRLKNGEPFEKIAETESISPTREKRGEIGWIEVEKLDPDVSSLISQLRPGEILANIIKTDAGYHIVKLTGRTEKRILTLEEAKPMIRNILISQRKKIEVENLMKKLKENGKIKVNTDMIEILKRKIK